MKTMNKDKLAPVALFVYDRLKNTKRTVEALKKNRYAGQTVLYVFSDGGKDRVSWKRVNRLRRYLKTIQGFGQVIVRERPENYYLERNIIEGVTSVLKKHGKVIVLEDDVTTNPFFLAYMNEALDFYKDRPAVMHISALTFWDEPGRREVIFTPYMSCGWGWATWQDRWENFRHYKTREEAVEGLTEADFLKLEYGGNFHCLKTLDRDPIPWDICWYLTIYKKGGLCVIPPQLMSQNTGLYAGTHFNTSRIWGKYVYDRRFRMVEVKGFTTEIGPEDAYERKLADFFSQPMMRYNLLGKVARYLYLKWKTNSRKA